MFGAWVLVLSSLLLLRMLKNAELLTLALCDHAVPLPSLAKDKGEYITNSNIGIVNLFSAWSNRNYIIYGNWQSSQISMFSCHTLS